MTKLQKYFRIYNKKYFDDALPEPTLRWAEMKDFGHYYCELVDRINEADEVVSTRDHHVIELGKWSCSNNTIWRLTLLHEMCHLKLRNKKCSTHGVLFNREMKRLANAGAFNGLW